MDTGTFNIDHIIPDLIPIYKLLKPEYAKYTDDEMGPIVNKWAQSLLSDGGKSNLSNTLNHAYDTILMTNSRVDGKELKEVITKLISDVEGLTGAPGGSIVAVQNDLGNDEVTYDRSGTIETEITPGGLPVYKQYKGDQASRDQNILLQLLLPQGGNKYNKVNRPTEDIETENMARMVDRINNKLYFDPSIVTVGDSFGIANKGEIKEPPKMETEDTRSQGLRREFENARRTWNSGLMQEGKKFEQEMALAQKYRDAINDVVENGLNAEAIARETDKGRQQVLKDLAGAKADTRSLALRLVESLFNTIDFWAR